MPYNHIDPYGNKWVQATDPYGSIWHIKKYWKTRIPVFLWGGRGKVKRPFAACSFGRRGSAGPQRSGGPADFRRGLGLRYDNVTYKGYTA